MCGIFGALSLTDKFDEKDFSKFVKLTDIVSYRGPDASDYKSFDTQNKSVNKSQFDLFFGHRRLSIIDLSDDGKQPLYSDNCWIIFNGEIFNYVELREELKSKNYNFHTNTDTEVIIKIYKEFGERGFDKLNGMWAFALYDMQLNKLILSRDRFSIKPLFIYNQINRLFFASEIKQLIPLLEKKELELDNMLVFLQQGILDFDEKTLFKQIYRVKAKTNLIIDFNSKQIEEKKYWDYSNEPIEGTDKKINSMFRDLFIDSVKIRLRSDVQIGSLLSGGLDSSAITFSALNCTGNSLKTFSVISNQKEFSEEKYIDIITQKFNIHNKKILLDADQLKNDLDKVIEHQDEPFNYFIPVAHFNLIKALNENSDIVVILNGQGGDETLLGYLRFYFFYWKKLLKEKEFSLLTKELFASVLNRTAIFQFRLNVAKRYMPQKLLTKKNFLLQNHNLINVWEYNDLRTSQINDIDYYSVPFLNRYEDRNSMAFSKEIRLPFLDHRLVDFLVNISPDKKMKNGWSKYILRKSFPELPKQIRWRRDKKGFVLPESKWLKEDLRDSIHSMFGGKNFLSQFGLIDSNKFLEYYNDFLNGDKIIHSTDISRIFIAEKWLEKYFN
ncbi:Glutamine-hydrolyzing asparagine synthase [Ignavibacterium album JCM 16511]|uniref:asparagine synthase (glutamine-hydrolyzing) n=1 Tax=Ignavibacterium album (strain DSM 19864 / JCM 16511 / NBRC 101810 / Mat9-16) TaxID=945713 RepID=I0ALC6_IGNAJ|nr:asparagine synthase (glutamine-hydrolyzing) [Ignavibacterium album]AFH49783.1 Glutamine-hydrolyzing asparagine synthase [Ignavibacterium album JCM 16511]